MEIAEKVHVKKEEHIADRNCYFAALAEDEQESNGPESSDEDHEDSSGGEADSGDDSEPEKSNESDSGSRRISDSVNTYTFTGVDLENTTDTSDLETTSDTSVFEST